MLNSKVELFFIFLLGQSFSSGIFLIVAHGRTTKFNWPKFEDGLSRESAIATNANRQKQSETMPVVVKANFIFIGARIQV